MTESVILIFTISTAVMIASFIWAAACFMDKTNKALKDLKDNQFDANEVMKLYAMKYAPKPQIIAEKRDVVPLYATYELPSWAGNEVEQEEINRYLTDEMSRQIFEYMDIVVDRDIVRMSTKYKARLQVIDTQHKKN